MHVCSVSGQDDDNCGCTTPCEASPAILGVAWLLNPSQLSTTATDSEQLAPTQPYGEPAVVDPEAVTAASEQALSIARLRLVSAARITVIRQEVDLLTVIRQAHVDSQEEEVEEGWFRIMRIVYEANNTLQS